MAEDRESAGFPKSDFIARYDGNRWRKFELNSGGTLILTARGQEIMAFNPQLRKHVLAYRSEAQNNKQKDFRKWFKAGGNSDVYKFGDRPMVMKEASTAYSVWNALDRMDYLYGICRKFLPNYIRVPDHYGILYSPDLKKQYLLMQKVNEGLTVADLLNDTNGNINEGLKKLAIMEFQGLEDKVRNVIDSAPGRDQMPRELLPDWSAGNVIVDFTTPTKEMPFTFWIIDQ